MKSTKTLHVRVYVQAYYDSKIEVPTQLSLEEAFNYANDIIDEIPLTDMHYINDSDELDYEDLTNEKHTYFEKE